MNWRSLRNPAFLIALAVLVTASLGLSAAISGFKIYLTKKPIYPPENRQLRSIPKETRSWIAVGADQLVDGDTLKVSYNLRDDQRPTEFQSKPDSGLVLVVHKRAK